MSEFASMPIYVDAYWSDTVPHLTLEEHGAYYLLLCTQWKRPDDNIPDDDKWLCKLLGVHGNKWKKLRSAVLERFFDRDQRGDFYSKRLRKERDFLRKQKRKQKENSIKANAVRWNNNGLDDPSRIPPNLTYIESESNTESEPRIRKTESDKDSPLNPPKGGKRKKPSVPWPDDFGLDDEMIAYAEKQTPGVDAAKDFENFRTWALKKDQRYANWKMAWQSWCRSEFAKPMKANAKGTNGHDPGLDFFRRKRSAASGVPARPNGHRQDQANGGTNGRSGHVDAGRSLDPNPQDRGDDVEGGTHFAALDGPPEFEDVPFADESGTPIVEGQLRVVASARSV